MQASNPGSAIHTDLILIGGGHSHALVLRRWAMRPLPGVRLTLVSPQVQTPYSGMLPGLVAGHYRFDETHIDLARLCQFAGARFIQSSVTGLDLERRLIALDGRPELEADVLSINCGITPELSVPGAQQYSTPVKPVASFYARWQSLRQRLRQRAAQAHGDTPLAIGIAGGGAAGVELIQAMRYALSRDPQVKAALQFHLLQKGAGLPEGYPRALQRQLAKRLADQQIRVHEHFEVSQVDAGGVVDQHGRRLPLQEVFWCTAAAAPDWPQRAGLKTDAGGFIEVNPQLQSSSHEWVFASGDIAHLAHDPRPKAGVFAVRQGPLLAQNLARFIRRRPLRRYRPQRRFLSLIACGGHYALASRGPLNLGGGWVWHWKDRIDRRFIRHLNQLPPMAAAAAAKPTAQPMRCNGCGAKVGADILARVLRRLQQQPGVDFTPGSDDAAAVAVPAGTQLLQSVDFFRALIDDPYRLGRIAALHALNDLFAMHASPLSAQALVILPYSSEAIMERELYQLLAGALSALSAHGCSLIGGHSAEGAELGLGFCVNGAATGDTLIRKRGIHAGDKLILTKPLGTGVLFAAFMRGAAAGSWIAAALEHMEQSNAAAADILQRHGASACTDITGFGLLGHLREMLAGGGPAVGLELDQLPLLQGAVECASRGYLSSLHPHNEAAGRLIQNRETGCRHARYPLLFDPQTAGGLLASLPPAQAADCLATLHNAGYKDARIIGEAQAADLPPFVLLR